MARRRFEMKAGGSSKFWEVSVDGTQHIVAFGRIGTTGQSKKSTFPSKAAAAKDAEALVTSKLAKGYREIGSMVASGGRSAMAGPTRTAKRALVRCKGTVFGQFAMPGGRLLCILRGKDAEEGGTMHVWGSDGKELSKTFEFPDADIDGVGRTLSGDVVCICQARIYRLKADGTHSHESVPGVSGANYCDDGTALLQFGDGDLKLRTPAGKLRDVVSVPGRGLSFWPVLLADGGFALVAKEQPRRLMLFGKSGARTLDLKLAGNGSTVPVQAPDGRVIVVSIETLHLVGPGKKHVKARLGAGATCGPLALPNGWVAVANKLGTVEFFSPDGKKKATFRTDPLGAGESEGGIVTMADGTVIAPSKAGTYFRLSPTGELLGSFESKVAPDEILALDDGTVATLEGTTWQLVGAADFKVAKAPAGPPDLSAEHPKLKEHFASWTLTPRCRRTLDELLGRLVELERKGKELTLGFLSDEQEIYRIRFGAPEKVRGDWPQSYRAVSALHGDIVFGEGPPIDIHFGNCIANLDGEAAERFSGICDAGQNWLLFDSTKKNKLGEPVIVLYDHARAAEDAEPFPAQNKEAFGLGGLLLRCIAHRVFSKKPEYEDFGWG